MTKFGGESEPYEGTDGQQEYIIEIHFEYHGSARDALAVAESVADGRGRVPMGARGRVTGMWNEQGDLVDT